jgi:hypothetical protein
LVVRPGEQAAWRALMERHRHLGFELLIGESLCYVA